MISFNSALQISPNNPYFNELYDKEIKKSTKKKQFNPTQIHVSTMTGCAKICDWIDTRKLYENLDIVEIELDDIKLPKNAEVNQLIKLAVNA